MAKAKSSVIRVGVVQAAMIEHRRRTGDQMRQGIMELEEITGNSCELVLFSQREAGCHRSSTNGGSNSVMFIAGASSHFGRAIEGPRRGLRQS
jgi:hypothetical protein